MFKNKFFAVVLGILLFVILLQFSPEKTCRDGWHSPSIGKRGACSHHGGVKKSPMFIFFLISVASGVYAYFYLEKRSESNKHENSTHSTEEGYIIFSDIERSFCIIRADSGKDVVANYCDINDFAKEKIINNSRVKFIKFRAEKGWIAKNVTLIDQK